MAPPRICRRRGPGSVDLCLAFLIVTGTLLGSWVVCLIRSWTAVWARWAATSRGEALGQGFLSSRWRAIKEAPWGEPMLRIHPPDGHQYIPWLTDVFMVVLWVLAVVAWCFWIARSMRHAHSSTSDRVNFRNEARRHSQIVRSPATSRRSRATSSGRAPANPMPGIKLDKALALADAIEDQELATKMQLRKRS